jgi:hypothetical protein
MPGIFREIDSNVKPAVSGTSGGEGRGLLKRVKELLSLERHLGTGKGCKYYRQLGG